MFDHRRDGSRMATRLETLTPPLSALYASWKIDEVHAFLHAGRARHAGRASQAVKTSVKSITLDHFEKNSRGQRVYAAPYAHQYFIQQMRNARKKLPFSRLTPQRLLI